MNFRWVGLETKKTRFLGVMWIQKFLPSCLVFMCKVNFSLNLMHQITCCAALVSPRIGNAIVEMSHVFICSR